VAIAGIARPERFFATVTSLGWEITRQMAFGDHHWFTRKDVAAIHEAVQATGAAGVVTTEKDAVRLTALPLPATTVWTYLPMRSAIEPPHEFREWFMGRLAEARSAHATREAGAR
jgi:tetraacyldisaccharide 4'-kinase